MRSIFLVMLVGLLTGGVFQPASASGGWLWFDKYPWVYSFKEQSWIYLAVEGGKLYAYRSSTKEWSEFNVSESSTDTASGQTSTDSSTSNATSSFDPSNPPKTWTTSSTSNIEMIWVEPGTILSITLTNGFYLGKYEVTQAEYEAVMTGNTNSLSPTPSYWPGNPNRPVEMVSWDDAQVFLTRLNAAEHAAGRLPADWSYVLPTESQWEYACRAGTTTAYSWGDSIAGMNANYNASGYSQTRDVGQYAANPWGFFDMHGNVSEWSSDESFSSGNTTYFIEKGGSWQSPPENLRSSEMLAPNPSTDRKNIIGFRISLQKQ